jgi:hypothetical protein
MSEQPDKQYLARIEDGELCSYEIIDGKLVERPATLVPSTETFLEPNT